MGTGRMKPTFSGHSLFDVASALQKSVRRGLEEEALHWAIDLERAGYGEYAWKRMRIMTSEDIGLANPGLPPCIASLYATWKACDDDTRRAVFVQAVRTLVRSQKSRLVDHALMVFYHLAETNPFNMDSLRLVNKLRAALEKREERKALHLAAYMNRTGLVDCVWSALRVAGANRSFDEMYIAPAIHSLHEIWGQVRKKNDDKHEPERLMLMHAVLLHTRGEESFNLDKVVRNYYSGTWRKREIPEYAHDKHSLRGRRMGRGVRHFFEEGAFLKNDRCYVDPYREQAQVIMEAKEAEEKEAKQKEKEKAKERAASQGRLL
ncbi:MAG: hypothetical protein RIF32_15245 [Leptospirales bacterium]